MRADPRRFARVVIVDQKGRVLAIRQGGDGDRFYCFPGGKVELGESPKGAAVREIVEELGIKLSARMLKPLLSRRFEFSGTLWLGYYYLCIYTGSRPTLREAPKIDEATFFFPDDLDILPADRASFTDVARFAAQHIVRLHETLL